MKKHVFYWLAVILVVFIGCQKEVSFENGNTPAQGSLRSDGTGDCLPKTVNGAYVATTALSPTTNTITVQVNVLNTGNYVITTDTVNGYYFRANGVFTTLGNVDVTLRGNGTPFTNGVDNFIVNFDSTVCDIAVTVLPAGTGAAVFTLSGAPAACTGAVVSGVYSTGTALTSTNTAALSVNVTTVGTYTITTTFQGMTFAASGAFTATGPNTVTLVGTGTPTTGGLNTVPLTVGTSTCSFPVTVSSPAVFTLAGSPTTCTTPTIAGTYALGVALTAANTVTLNVNVTTAGAYVISTAPAVGGMVFSGSGTLAVGPQTIVLTASGVPTVAGNNTIPITTGASNCTFVINVTGSNAVYNINCPGATANGTYQVGVALGASNTITLPITVSTAGAYTLTATINGMTFTNSGTLTLGTTSITLNGTGTPTTAGTVNLSVGAPVCTISIVCNPAPSMDYFPRTTGSNWSYEIDDDGNDSLYQQVIATPIVRLGNTYSIFMSNDGSGAPLPALPDSSGYYRKNGTDYFEYVDMVRFIGLDPPAQWGEYIMLKDAPVNTTWNSAAYTGVVTIPPPTPVTVRLKFTITQRDIAVPVVTSLGTINYQNVIVVKQEYEQQVGPNWVPLNVHFENYYARGIGLVQALFFQGGTTPTFKYELRRHRVL